MFSLNCLVCVEEINLSFVSFEDISIEDQKTLISLGYSPALDWEYMTERSIACDLQDDPTDEEIENSANPLDRLFDVYAYGLNETHITFELLNDGEDYLYLSQGYSPAIAICDLDEFGIVYGETCWEIDNYQEANTDLADELLGVLAEIKKTDWVKCYNDVHDPDSIDTEDPRF